MRITFLKIAIGILATTTVALQASSTISSDVCSSSSSSSPLPSKEELIEKLNSIFHGFKFQPEISTQYKPVIVALIEQHNMHPDDIRVSCSHERWIGPLEKFVELNDVEFAEFLLIHKANPNYNYCGYNFETPILNTVQTKEMAELLFRYGAKMPQDILFHDLYSWANPREAALTSLLIRKGALINNQNGSNNNWSPLLCAAHNTKMYANNANINKGPSDGEHPDYAMAEYYKAQFLKESATLLTLINARASITPKPSGGLFSEYSAPTFIKIALDEATAPGGEDVVQQLETIRLRMKKMYEEHEKPIITQTVKQALEKHLIPDLASLVVDYMDVDYEELEKSPEPAPLSKE